MAGGSKRRRKTADKAEEAEKAPEMKKTRSQSSVSAAQERNLEEESMDAKSNGVTFCLDNDDDDASDNDNVPEIRAPPSSSNGVSSKPSFHRFDPIFFASI